MLMLPRGGLVVWLPLQSFLKTWDLGFIYHGGLREHLVARCRSIFRQTVECCWIGDERSWMPQNAPSSRMQPPQRNGKYNHLYGYNLCRGGQGLEKLNGVCMPLPTYSWTVGFGAEHPSP